MLCYGDIFLLPTTFLKLPWSGIKRVDVHTNKPCERCGFAVSVCCTASQTFIWRRSWALRAPAERRGTDRHRWPEAATSDYDSASALCVSNCAPLQIPLEKVDFSHPGAATHSWDSGRFLSLCAQPTAVTTSGCGGRHAVKFNTASSSFNPQGCW